MGPSGSGKSTLLNLLGALDRAHRAATSCSRASRSASRRTSISFALRRSASCFNRSICCRRSRRSRTCRFRCLNRRSARSDARQKAAELLELVGMSHRAKHLPAKLSVGERQRVAIARALANDPKLLLADEPTGNLDSASGNIVLDLFDRLHRERGLTLVVITHDAEVAARAERTRLDSRRAASKLVIASGTRPCRLWQIAGRISGGGPCARC